jgi:hypothetical protein
VANVEHERSNRQITISRNDIAMSPDDPCHGQRPCLQTPKEPNCRGMRAQNVPPNTSCQLRRPRHPVLRDTLTGTSRMCDFVHFCSCLHDSARNAAATAIVGTDAATLAALRLHDGSGGG